MVPPQRDRAAAELPAVEYDSGMTTSRRQGLWAAVILIIVLVAAAVLVLTRGGDDQPSRSADPAVPAASVSPEAAGTPPSPSAAPLTAAPSGVQWELFQGVALPTSRSDGPKRVDGPVHAGFTRTPTGALIAAAQIQYRSLVTPSLAGLQAVVDNQLVDGPGRTAYLNLLGQLTDFEPPAQGFTQIVGFRYVAFSPDLAVVTLATRGNSGKIQAGTVTLRWMAGDWRLDLPASGLQQPQVVQDISGFVPWSGVS